MQTFKSIHELSRKLIVFTTRIQLKTATLVWLVMIGFVSSLLIDGCLEEKPLTQLFGLQFPNFHHLYYLWFPTLISFLVVQVTLKLSPQQKPWSRLVIVSILGVLTSRYLIWRSLTTLNLSNPINGLFSIGLFLMEIVIIVTYLFQMYLLLQIKPRHQEADQMSMAVIEGKYTPTVDILIPTTNEPDYILKRTIIGCQSLDYFHKQIYILDDRQRPEVKQLAEELGCEYITRPDNLHAKAGNLNHALTKTDGELIVVFDADFIPTTNFLTRTIGFFQNPRIALLQTYQSFYNPDPIARNLGLENILPQEVEIFSRQYQLLRDAIETALCYGSSFVTRRSALKEIGGFVTESLSEDYFTGISLTSQGYQVIYLGESLSAGLSAENMAAYIRQKLRWSRGTLQAFFIKENPLTVSGLTFFQRLAHLEGISQWFTSIFRAIFLCVPLVFMLLNIIPVKATLTDWTYYFIPFYLIQLITFSWLNYRSRSALISDIYAVAHCFPVAVNIFQTLISPFSVKFKVTPKGISSDRFKFNGKLAFPLIVVFILNLISLDYSLNISLSYQTEGIQLAWIWSAYNLIIVGIALLAMIDVPKTNIYEWFNLKKAVRIFNGNQTVKGVTTKLSEGGAEIELTQALKLTSSLKIEIIETGLTLQGKVIETQLKGNLQKIRVDFEQVSLEDYRSLVELLFCRPGRWKLRQTPGELQSLGLLLKVLLKPRFLKRVSS